MLIFVLLPHYISEENAIVSTIYFYYIYQTTTAFLNLYLNSNMPVNIQNIVTRESWPRQAAERATKNFK